VGGAITIGCLAWLPSIDRGLGFHLPIQINNKIFALAKNMPGAAGGN
jgi:hypothetical protein